jgi:formylglycine-generating enzyme
VERARLHRVTKLCQVTRNHLHIGQDRRTRIGREVAHTGSSEVLTRWHRNISTGVLLGLVCTSACSLLIDDHPDGIAGASGLAAGSHSRDSSSNIQWGGAAGSTTQNAVSGSGGKSEPTRSGIAGTFVLGGAGGTVLVSGAVAGATSNGGSASSSTTNTPETGGASALGGFAGAGSSTDGVTGGRATMGGAPTTTTTSLSCPDLAGPRLVKMPGDYCIDATEVTRAQYSTWLLALSADAINKQDPICAGNTAFEPSPTCMAGIPGASVCQLGCDSHLQVCVDWCDAAAYCKSVGKRLCGKIGGGPNAFADYGDASTSQWYNACSAGGTQIYPYGDTYQATYCNGAEYAAGTTVPVGFIVRCRAIAPFGGVNDLSGNVSEWEDSCEGDNCRLRGGSFYGGPGTKVDEVVACASTASAPPRSFEGSSVGFRCCFP